MKKVLASVAIFILAFIGLQGINKSDDSCINLYVDYGQLDNGTKLTKCIDASIKTIALDVLKKANLEIEGTKKYGLGVVCRVNNLQDENAESCEIMTTEKA